MPITDLIDFDAKVRTTGLFSPYTHCWFVDQGGAGDFLTIGEASNAALATGSRCYIKVGPGNYTENVEIFKDVHIAGSAREGVIIVGTLTIHADGSGQNFAVQPPDGSSFWCHFIADTARAVPRATLSNVHGRLDGSYAGMMVGVKVSGNTTTSVLQAWGCSNQVENKSTHPSASIRGWYIQSGTVNTYVEWYGGQFKTNASTTGTARNPIAIECNGTGTSYVRLEGVCWFPAKAISVQRLLGTNPNHPGMTGILPVDHDGDLYGGGLTFVPDSTAISAYPKGLLYSVSYKNIEATGKLSAAGTWQNPFFLGTEAIWRNITDGRLYTKNGTPASDTDGEPIRTPRPGLTSGQYYSSQFLQTATTAALSGVISYMPYQVYKSTTFNRLAVDVTTGAAGAVIRAGIYSDNGFGAPGSLVAEYGTATAASTALVTITPSNFTLAAGLYWVAIKFEVASITVRVLTGQAEMVQQVNNRTSAGYQSGALSAGALPSTADITGGPVLNVVRALMRAA